MVALKTYDKPVHLCPCGGESFVRNARDANRNPSNYVYRERTCKSCGTKWHTAELHHGTAARLLKLERLIKELFPQ